MEENNENCVVIHEEDDQIIVLEPVCMCILKVSV